MVNNEIIGISNDTYEALKSIENEIEPHNVDSIIMNLIKVIKMYSLKEIVNEVNEIKDRLKKIENILSQRYPQVSQSNYVSSIIKSAMSSRPDYHLLVENILSSIKNDLVELVEISIESGVEKRNTSLSEYMSLGEKWSTDKGSGGSTSGGPMTGGPNGI